MIENVQGPGAGSPRPPRPGGSQGKPSRPGGAPGPVRPSSVAPEYSRRLGSVAATLETLQQQLASLQSGGGNSSEEARLLGEISAAQVAFQNILSTDTAGEPAVLDSLTGQTAVGHALKPSIVLQLLE
ncbi:MAG: hypothetical protein ACYTAF_09925 [Planctomycetota bacterium]|jgi:hypothetical protein